MEEAAAGPAARQGETVLIVADQEEVRLLARAILKLRGYRVLEAGTVPEAVETPQRETGPIDLVLTDVVLADGNGPDVVERLRLRRPGLKALYMTGYTDDTILRYGVETGRMAIVEKPFTAVQLERRIREVLDFAGS